jgi:hypothetical protein
MNSKIVTLAIAVLSLAVVATTANLSTMVYAEKQEDPNCFGEESSELGKSGQMGDHSEEGSSAGDAPFDENPMTNDPDKPGRSGIDNVGEDLGVTPGSKHPSDLAEALNTGDCETEDEED